MRPGSTETISYKLVREREVNGVLTEVPIDLTGADITYYIRDATTLVDLRSLNNIADPTSVVIRSPATAGIIDIHPPSTFWQPPKAVVRERVKVVRPGVADLIVPDSLELENLVLIDAV